MMFHFSVAFSLGAGSFLTPSADAIGRGLSASSNPLPHLLPQPRSQPLPSRYPIPDRGETTPPPAPARARSVNTYARPSPHGNIRASRAHSLTCSADRMPAPWAADDLVGRAEQPPHTIRQALNHPQRAAAHRAALPAKLALHSTVNRRTTQYIIQHTPARTQHRRRTRDSNTH